MVKRRFAQVASDDEDDAPPPPPPRRASSRSRSSNENDEDDDGGEQHTDDKREDDAYHINRRKKMKKDYGGADQEVGEMEEVDEEDNRKKKKLRGKAYEEEEWEDEEEDVAEDAKPLGEVIRVSGKGRKKREYYKAFEYDGLQYELEDPVLLVPEVQNQKPYVAIIKDISKDHKGSMKVMGQWFYRPEEAEKRGGGNWQSRDTRELFYSFHRDEVPAESVMHKCVVHFVPKNKQVPNRKEHPGFIVQKVYDTDLRRLFKLTDKDYEDSKQEEIDLLVQKTVSRIGDLPDIEEEDSAPDHEESKSKRLMRKRNVAPLDVSREDGGSKSGQSQKPETPGSYTSNFSEHYSILSKFKVLTGDSHRDKWLEKLLQVIQAICTSGDGRSEGKEKSSPDGSSPSSTKIKDAASYSWPDCAFPAVPGLENAAHEAFSSDFQKYNQKMRQMTFNLKPNALLSRRLLNGELEPLQIVNMTPNELKEGLTAEEIASRQPEESQHLQMTDARCKRCSLKKVGLREIIQAGTGDRYQLECTNCGNTWYAFRDEAAALTIDGSSGSKTVGTAPLATAKFEDAEKALSSPRGAEAEGEAEGQGARGDNDAL